MPCCIQQALCERLLHNAGLLFTTLQDGLADKSRDNRGSEAMIEIVRFLKNREASR